MGVGRGRPAGGHHRAAALCQDGLAGGSTLLASQLCEQLGFALRGNTGAELGLTLGGQGKEPGQRVGGGERQGPVGEARSDDATDVAAVEAKRFAPPGIHTDAQLPIRLYPQTS